MQPTSDHDRQTYEPPLNLAHNEEHQPESVQIQASASINEKQAM
jgi:hypothetical protein